MVSKNKGIRGRRGRKQCPLSFAGDNGTGLCAAIIVLVTLAPAVLRAQTTDSLPFPIEPSQPPQSSQGVLGVLGEEAKTYWADARALVAAPLSWGREDRYRAAGVVVLVGGLMAFDERLASESQERRSAGTDRLSRLTTGLGAGDAWAISGGLLATGLVFGDRRLTTMGREAIEASLFAGVIANVVKPVFGRERPLLSNNEAIFKPGTSNYSFPSGHATEAFAVASVVAIRSSGWVIPTLAYTCASLVAFDRVNDRAHFPSDVLAGAALGVAVGRFIAHRHDRLEETGTPRLTLSLEPIPHGLGLRARF